MFKLRKDLILNTFESYIKTLNLSMGKEKKPEGFHSYWLNMVKTEP